jgi:hypothetical protein
MLITVGIMDSHPGKRIQKGISKELNKISLRQLFILDGFAVARCQTKTHQTIR